MTTKRRESGFTILEVAVATAAIGILLVPLARYTLQQVSRQQVSQVSADILAIGEAAQNYQADNGTFPDQANATPCANPLPVLSAAGYIGNASTTTAWGNAYRFACPTTGTGTVFNVTVVAPLSPVSCPACAKSQEAASLLRQVVRGSIAADGQTVTSSFPVASNAPALNLLLHRYATAGHPEYNQMETAIDMNANAINNGGQITSNQTGQAFYAPNGTFTSAVADQATSGVSAFYASHGQFKSDQTATNTPAFLATGSSFESDKAYAAGAAFYTPAGQFMSGAAAGNNAFVATAGNFFAQSGSFQSGSTGVAFNATAGSIQWGPNQNQLSTDQGGAIELGSANGAANSAGNTPYIDFHYGNGAAQNYNTRVINDADGQLSVAANVVHIGDGQTGNVVADGQVAATDLITTYKGVRTLSQSVQDVAIVDAADSVPNRTFTETCPNTETPTIYTAVSQAAEGATAYPMNQLATFATDNGTTTSGNTVTKSWTVAMQILTSNPSATGMQTPQAGYGRILVMTKCA